MTELSPELARAIHTAYLSHNRQGDVLRRKWEKYPPSERQYELLIFITCFRFRKLSRIAEALKCDESSLQADLRFLKRERLIHIQSRKNGDSIVPDWSVISCIGAGGSCEKYLTEQGFKPDDIRLFFRDRCRVSRIVSRTLKKRDLAMEEVAA